MTSRSLTSIFILAVALVLAVFAGVSIVTAQLETLGWIVVGGTLIACMVLGRRIWLLLILFSAINVPIIRGFGTAETGQLLFIAFTFAMALMRRQKFNFRFGEMELWVLLLAASIAQTYLRNPVGLGMFGAETLGARPYFMAAMTFLSSVILANIVVRASDLKWALWLSVIGSILGVGLYQLRVGLGVGSAGFEQGRQIDDGQGSGRIGPLVNLSITAARVSASFISPLRAMFHPFWALVILFAIVAATMSGYRNTVAHVGLILLVGLAYRSGGKAVVASTFIGAFGLGLIAFVNLVHPLPPNVQRALSPFPGTWEERHVMVAEQSTEWRVEMWKEALLTDYWIHNKIFGDGLGFTRREYEMMEDDIQGGGRLDSRGSGLSRQQEAMMVSGGYHSGPVQTVRAVGYVGLAILILAMFRIAVHAHRQIIRCRGTEWFPVALYFGIPAIVLPPFFILIMGTFGNASASIFFSYALISLLEKNLPLPAYVPRIAVNRSSQGALNKRSPAIKV